MQNEKKNSEPPKSLKPRDYSLCRSSCAVCPYHQGLLKLLDHGNTIVPTLPENEQ